jgi:hypothetical protein
VLGWMSKAYPREPRDPPRSFADLSALLLVADQVQSIVDQKNDAINVAAKTPSPFVTFPIRPIAEPLFRVPAGLSAVLLGNDDVPT